MSSHSKIIRFRRKGNSYNSLYDLVVSQRFYRNKSIFIEKIGFFDPKRIQWSYVNFYRLGF